MVMGRSIGRTSSPAEAEALNDVGDNGRRGATSTLTDEPPTVAASARPWHLAGRPSPPCAAVPPSCRRVRWARCARSSASAHEAGERNEVLMPGRDGPRRQDIQRGARTIAAVFRLPVVRPSTPRREGSTNRTGVPTTRPAADGNWQRHRRPCISRAKAPSRNRSAGRAADHRPAGPAERSHVVVRTPPKRLSTPPCPSTTGP